MYIRNYGTNLTWFNFAPGYTRIDAVLIGRISSSRTNVPADFRARPHRGKTG
jgi:hypothetical protein